MQKNKKSETARAGAQVDEHSSNAIYATKLGKMYCGSTEQLLARQRLKKNEGKVQLIFTSPPFPLNTKKRYGNFNGDEYIKWLADFAPLFTKLLTPDGSIVLEVGNAWEAGEPVMSTVVLRSLLAFMDKAKLHLCQEFVWYNPARLPAPIQWVNVERARVKDAFTRIWWLSPVTRPKADNRRVLRPYSPSMTKLIKSKSYNSGPRPSQYNIGKTSFAADNGGAIPPNVIGGDDAPSLTSLLKGTNTRSTEQYQMFCRENDLPLHPARMPTELAEFFIKFLTDEGDLVLDPFAGSNTTGAAAERLKRRWLSIEARWEYACASIARFGDASISRRSKKFPVLQRAHSSESVPVSPLLTS